MFLGGAHEALRCFTGPDDASFCERITAALDPGWELYGNPTLAYNEKLKRVICGQALVKEVEGIEYTPDIDLSKQ